LLVKVFKNPDLGSRPASSQANFSDVPSFLTYEIVGLKGAFLARVLECVAFAEERLVQPRPN
jgi:hypothetical protein